uniref:Uncharacterized protein n=1 Tax=Anopheles culicifacies TaxID=139723 RepID=A0A182M670_9DIPT
MEPQNNITVRCFSANSTSFLSTGKPLRSRIASIYTRATFVKSAFSPYCRYSSSVDGTQCGSISTVSQWLKTSCGIAKPDVCLRISVAKLNDSITGMTAVTSNWPLPSIRSADCIRPCRRPITAYSLPTGLAPTKYHYYPHNQHIYFLPECAIQQRANEMRILVTNFRVQ